MVPTATASRQCAATDPGPDYMGGPDMAPHELTLDHTGPSRSMQDGILRGPFPGR